jgi:hypothetical protein
LLGCVVFSARAGVHASPGDALPYSKGFLLTGNYVAGGVDLTEQTNPIDANGFSTGTIHMSGVPADADIVAAYLYWETITLTASLNQAAGATFRGQPILLNDVAGVKKSSMPLTGSTASCWSSGVPLTLTMFRADVLRWLPIRMDKDNQPTGKRLVNDVDLIAHGLPLHQVKLPERSGNQVPESAGASLVVVYRDPAQPLRKIVVYDGVHVQSSLSEVTTQSLQGFYKSSAATSAQITHIVGAGQPNKNERIFFNDGSNTQISPADPITGGSSSQRSWSTLTYDVSALMNPGNNSAGGYGETATTQVDHSAGGGYDCLSWGAIVFSTSVADADGDGLPDGLEDASGGLKDPDGQALPNLNAMGASSAHKDLFVEFNGLWAPAGTSYGGPNAPYNSTTVTLTDPNGHNHMPTPDTLKMIGDAYVAHGITPHFDVGDIATYHAPNPTNDPQKLGVAPHVDWVDDYTSTVADAYLVPSKDSSGNPLARGGEVIKEVACNSAVATCQFPDFPGTVGWKLGLEIYRDQPVGDNGEEISLNPQDPGYFDWSTGTHRRRFDRNRFGLFHYVLNAHARGSSKSDLPCVAAGVPGPYDANNGTSCVMNNPDFHVPSSRSGVADLPGGSALITLGLWDDFVGRPFVRASTTFHELGHNLNLWHGGRPAIWGNAHPLTGAPTSTYIEPNCGPNYISSMSYLFQVIGLFDNSDNIHFDYSSSDYTGTAFGSLDETTALLNVVPPTPTYIPAWFAPAASPLATALGTPAAKRFCDGSTFNPAAPPAPMARVHAASTLDPIYWSGDPAQLLAGLNVNFDGTATGSPVLSTALLGFNDWANIRLDQIDAGRRAVKFQNGDFADFGSGDFVDFGSGDFTDYGSGDFVDFGSGDFTDFGSGVFLDSTSGDFVDFGSGDFADFGSGDFADFGSGDFLDFGTGTVRQELDYDSARALATASPYALTACISGQDAGCAPAAPYTAQYHKVQVHWYASTVGHVFQYQIQRKTGNAASADSYVLVGTSPTLSFIDLTELSNGTPYSYRVRTEFDNETPHTFSPWSNPVTITAVNDAPMANGPQAIVTLEDTDVAITLTATDTDSAGPLVFTIVTPPSHGTLLGVAPNLTYHPNLNYNSVDGLDSFTFKANDTKLPYNNPGRDSNTATVSITVTPVNDRPSFTKGPNQSVSKNSGPHTVPAWATNFSPGPANESSQTILAYHVVSNTNPSLFSAAPAISTNGTLTYTSANGATGTATIGVTVQDNGGTLNGGLDTSDPPQTFTITVTK